MAHPRAWSCLFGLTLACGAPARAVTPTPALAATPTPAPAPVVAEVPHLALPDCWTSDVVPGDADARARLEAIARALAGQLHVVETGDLGGIGLTAQSLGDELTATHALVTQMPLDISSWRCPRITALVDDEVTDDSATAHVTLVFGSGEPLTLQVHLNLRPVAWSTDTHASLARELLLRTLPPVLAAWEAAHPEIHHASRIRIDADLDWTAITTDVDAVQCLREHDATDPSRVRAQHCWRAPRHQGFLPAVGVSAAISVSRRPDGAIELRGLTVENEPGVVWEVRLPEETYLPLDARHRPGRPHPLALVAPPDLGPMDPLLVEWHERIRRVTTPFGEAQCGTRDSRFVCVYPRPAP